KFTAWEVEANKADALPEMLRFSSELDRTGPDPARLALVDRIDRICGSSELAGEIAETSYIGGAYAARNALPEALRAPDERIAESAEQFRAQLAPESRKRTLANLYFVYRRASLAELRAYTESLENPRRRWYLTAVKDGYSVAMRKAMTEVGRYIGSHFS